MILEACTGSIRSVLAARQGGAQRVELCSGLDEGGITPSDGFLRAAMRTEGIKKHVLIRPRGGDFLYDAEEKAVILDDIRHCATLGVDGIVIGALLPNGAIDMEFMQECVHTYRKNAQEGSITFHRAFDLCRNPQEALEQIISLGFDRILTSGCAPKAEMGIPTLRNLIEQAKGRIIIMPGSGVSPQNATKILQETGATEIHASARSLVNSKMKFRHPNVSMGKEGSNEYAILETDPSIVNAIVNTL